MADFGLPATALAQAREILAHCPAVEKAVVYGSRAKGNYKPGSDIDLTLIGSELTHNMLARLVGLFEESSLTYQVDLSIKSDIDNPNLLEHIDRVGQIFYERA